MILKDPDRGSGDPEAETFEGSTKILHLLSRI